MKITFAKILIQNLHFNHKQINTSLTNLLLNNKYIQVINLIFDDNIKNFKKKII